MSKGPKQTARRQRPAGRGSVQAPALSACAEPQTAVAPALPLSAFGGNGIVHPGQSSPSLMVDNTPFFIVGAGRSGTTLLRLILAGHSRLHIPPETWFVRTLVSELPLTERLSAAEVDRAIGLMIDDYRWPDMGIAPDDLRRRVATLNGP